MSQRDAWFWAVLAVVALGVFAHAFIPRYDWRVVNENGTALVIYDKWTGRFQRAEYDTAGTVKTMQVLTPF
jgi:hypothetical protein